MARQGLEKGCFMATKLGKLSFEAQIEGKNLIIETGKIGKIAAGSAVCTSGDSVVMANVVLSDKFDPDRDFFPMTVDFEDKWYATGKISGSRFIKREGRGSELATLRSRMIDRPIRPMFPKGYMNEVQLVVTPLSLDETIDPVVLGITAASTALMLSGAPFEGPIGAVRMAKINGKIVANPSYDELAEANAELLVVGTEDAITMIEAEAKEIPENEFADMLEKAHEVIKENITLQHKLLAEVDVKKQEYQLNLPNEDAYEAVNKFLADKLGAAVRHEDKMERLSIIEELKDRVLEEFADDYEEKEVKESFERSIKQEVRRAILEDGKRPDNRQMDEIRPLESEAGVLPRTHGSGLFTRGATQVLSITTLASPGKAQVVESMDQDFEKFFMHHYSDAPYTYGEPRRLGPSRRAIGHGYLAEKALLAILPDKADFPYVIRVVSEILSCNGSSSMGSVCGASLSLADAGVPIKKHVAGIAMGLITEDGSLNGKYQVLTDLLGTEDFAGDMDFKAAGTRDGLTAFQLDIKIKGLKIDFIRDVLGKAKDARSKILDVMEAAIAEPRKEISKFAPRLTTLHINPDKIRTVIGKGGEMINKIIAETGAEIDIEDDGTIIVSAVNGESGQAAVDWIQGLVAEPEVGKTYTGKVDRLMDFGAFVQFMPGYVGLLHISQISEERVEKVSDFLKEGQTVKVKLNSIDDTGRYALTMKGVKQD